MSRKNLLFLVAGLAGCFSPKVPASSSGPGSSSGGTDPTLSTSASGDESSVADTTAMTVAETEDETGSPGTGSASSTSASTSGPACSSADCLEGLCVPDFSSDPAHCGGCGVGCGSGSCDDGVCEPEAVGFFPAPRDIDLNDDAVFIATDDGVTRVSLAELRESVALGRTGVRDISSTEELLFALIPDSNDTPRLLRAAESGGSSVDILEPPPQGLLSTAPSRLLASGGRVFWVQRWGESPDDFIDHVVSVAAGGGDRLEHAAFPNTTNVLLGVVGPYLYILSTETGEIGRSEVAGGMLDIVQSGVGGPAAATTEGLFWLDDAAEQTLLVRSELTGGDVDTLAAIEDGGAGDRAIAGAGGAVAWSVGESLYMCRVDACTPLLVGPDQEGEPVALSVSESAVAWAREGEVYVVPWVPE